MTEIITNASQTINEIALIPMNTTCGVVGLFGLVCFIAGMRLGSGGRVGRYYNTVKSRVKGLTQ